MSDENNLLNYTIGNKINILLEKQNKKQKDLAQFLDVNSNIISYWCNGARKPNIEQIIQIASFFNVTTDYLLGLSENKTTDTNLKAVCNYVNLKDETAQALHMGDTRVKQFIDFALNPENLTTFSDMCDSFCRYTAAISKLIEKQYIFLVEPLPQIDTKADFLQFFKDFKVIEENIDFIEYKTVKAFTNLLSLYKYKKFNDSDTKEMQKDFKKKWDKFIIKYEQDGD